MAKLKTIENKELNKKKRKLKFTKSPVGQFYICDEAREGRPTLDLPAIVR